MPTLEDSAISHSAVASPPRVGSRSTCVPGTASSSARTGSTTGALSETSSVSKSIPSRAAITAIPWSPTGPETITASPAAARFGPTSTPSRTRPMPDVFT